MAVAVVEAEAAPEPDYAAAVREALPATLEVVGQKLADSVRFSISARVAPDGTPWPLRKDGSPADFSSIAEDVTSRVIEGPAAQVAVEGPSAEFAAVHQYGNEHSPRRAFLPMPAPGVVELPPEAEEWTRETLRAAVFGAIASAKGDASTR